MVAGQIQNVPLYKEANPCNCCIFTHYVYVIGICLMDIEYNLQPKFEHTFRAKSYSTKQLIL